MEQFAQYGHAIVSMVGVAIFGLLVNPLTATKKMGQGLAAGGTPKGDYDDPVYRLNRAYLNLTEIMGFFVACVVGAILAGVSPFWVNLLASIFLISRIVLFFVHTRAIGPMNFGPRTFTFVIGWACCLILALMTIWAVF